MIPTPRCSPLNSSPRSPQESPEVRPEIAAVSVESMGCGSPRKDERHAGSQLGSRSRYHRRSDRRHCHLCRPLCGRGFKSDQSATGTVIRDPRGLGAVVASSAQGWQDCSSSSVRALSLTNLAPRTGRVRAFRRTYPCVSGATSSFRAPAQRQPGNGTPPVRSLAAWVRPIAAKTCASVRSSECGSALPLISPRGDGLGAPIPPGPSLCRRERDDDLSVRGNASTRVIAGRGGTATGTPSPDNGASVNMTGGASRDSQGLEQWLSFQKRRSSPTYYGGDRSETAGAHLGVSERSRDHHGQ
jgi:hypothetical protein